MKRASLTVLATVALAGVGLLGNISKASANENQFFNCVAQSNQMYFATIDDQSDAVIDWRATLRSSNPKGLYTPDGRCEAVSARLNNLVRSLGRDDLINMMKVGRFNGQTVIFVSNKKYATHDTVVLTLTPQNSRHARQILKDLKGLVEGLAQLPPIVN